MFIIFNCLQSKRLDDLVGISYELYAHVMKLFIFIGCAVVRWNRNFGGRAPDSREP